ncbi:MAG: hypothetical protein ACOC04_00400 [Halothece sp.]
MKPIALSFREEFTVSLDAALMEKVEKLTDDRNCAIEEALRLWVARQEEEKRHAMVNLRRQQQDEDETGWLI